LTIFLATFVSSADGRRFVDEGFDGVVVATNFDVIVAGDDFNSVAVVVGESTRT
jgi:hypothetical protein